MRSVEERDQQRKGLTAEVGDTEKWNHLLTWRRKAEV